MPEVICNTSPLQYLHQLGCLNLLPGLVGTVVVPGAVRAELAEGLARGVDLPDMGTLGWATLKNPTSERVLPLAADLGAGESAVLALALESASPIVLLDDALGRRAAEVLRTPMTGTRGLLIDAKKKGLIRSVREKLDQLVDLRFRVSTGTRDAVLAMACEV